MHDHDHSHGSADTLDQRRRLIIALLLTWAFAVIEVIAGWQGGSLALLADAGHMVTDGAVPSCMCWATCSAPWRPSLPAWWSG